MKKVFYVSYGGGQANISRVLYKAMEYDATIEQKVLALTVAPRVYDRSKVPYAVLADYLFLFNEKEAILEIGNRLAEKFHNEDSGLSFEETAVYMGFGYWDLVNRFGEDEAKKLFEEKERMAFFPVTVMRRIMDYENPDLLVITCGTRTEGAAATVANEKNIPVVKVMDCHKIYFHGPKCVYCVMNEAVRDRAIREYNIDPRDIVVTGHPVFDEDVKCEVSAMDTAKKELKLDNYEKMILFLPTARQFETPEILSFLNNLAEKYKKYCFAVKPHPNEKKEVYAEYTSNMLLLGNYPLSPLLNLTDLVIVTTSTSGMEASFVGKPIISIQLPGVELDPDWDLARLGIAYRVTDLNRLDDVIHKCLDSESDVNKILANGRKNFYNKENATANVVNVIKNILFNGELSNA